LNLETTHQSITDHRILATITIVYSIQKYSHCYYILSPDKFKARTKTMNMSQLGRSSSRCVRYAARSCVRSTNGSLSFAGAQMSALAHPPASSTSADVAVSMPSIRYFSAEAGPKQELLDILAREHAEEIENNSAGLPAELEELKKSLAADWKIVDDGANTKMYRTVGAMKVLVNFHCQDSVEIEENYTMENEEDEAAPEDEAASPVRFQVIATKAGKSFVYTCISEDATACIQSVAITTEDVDTILTNAAIMGNEYQGPDFEELAEDLQDAFSVYLTEDVGLNEDVASFIAMYADYKEQTKYVEFLKDAQALLD
jgi:complement component 1 Q subcomponent-binding protein